MIRRLFLLGSAFVAAVLFSSCSDVRLSESQARELSQAKENVAASRMSTDAASRSALLTAAGSRLMAGLFDVELPEPYTEAKQLVMDGVVDAPDGANTPVVVLSPAGKAEVKDAHEAEKSPPEGSVGWVGWLTGGALLVAGAIKLAFPGPLANIAYGLLASRAQRETDRKAHLLYQHGAEVLRYGVEMAKVAEEAFPSQADAIQRKRSAVQDLLGVQPVVNELLEKAKEASSIQI